MPVVLGTGFVLSEADEVPGTPWIGWHNLVTTSNVTATSEDADHLATNLANPSTNLYWLASVNSPAEGSYATFTIAAEADYLGVAKHNFGSAGIAVSVEGVTTNPAIDTFTKVLLHMDGADASTTFTDSSANPKTFTANGNAQIDTAQSVFGGASGFFDGTGDFITTPDHADFNIGSSDATVHFWMRVNAADGVQVQMCGQCDNAASAASTSFFIIREPANTITATFGVGGSHLSVNSVSTILQNTWAHIAVTIESGTAKLYINGTLEDTQALGGSVNNSTNALRLGSAGEVTTNRYNGWLDEWTFIVGQALWTADFDPPTIAGPWVQLTSPAVPADDSPLMFRWDPATYYQVRLRMQAGSEAPRAAVVYVGELLVCERSIDINVEHVPVTYGRRTHAVNGMSQSGEFLGRIVIGEHRETKAEFKWFQDTWWRTNFDPFLEAAQEIPFFWAWSPEEYPAECGYVWLTNDAEASVDPVTRRVHTELVMEGVA